MLHALLVYAPLSVIGLWRWSYWLIRVLGASLYRPVDIAWPDYIKQPRISVVTPVYNEDYTLFIQAMESWIKNGVDEIIAVIDRSNNHLIVDFERYYSKLEHVRCRLVVTAKPGKRAALCDGIASAKGDLIVLVDSDTIWSQDVAQKALPYFLNPQIGAVTIEQRILNPNTTSNVLFDILLWTRYREEVPFLLGLGKAFNTLSGRTAFYRREAILGPDSENLHKLRHESFLGARAVSGDDKRLTHLILEQGWHVGFAKGPVVYTQGMSKTKIFLKQRVRWMRNSWRADLRAIKRGWVWKHPVLAYFMIDRFIQPFFMLIGPVVCITAIITQHWSVVALMVAWWLVSRTIKLFSYFRRYPKRIVYLPAYIVYSYYNAFAKIYALATVLENSWVTRWDKARLKRAFVRHWAIVTTGAVAVVAFAGLLVYFTNYINTATSASIAEPPPVKNYEFTDHSNLSSTSSPPTDAILPTGIAHYVVQPGDNLTQLSSRFGIKLTELKKLNGIRNSNKINAGQNLLYYSSPSPPQGG